MASTCPAIASAFDLKVNLLSVWGCRLATLQEVYILLWKELTFSHRQGDRKWVIRWKLVDWEIDCMNKSPIDGFPLFRLLKLNTPILEGEDVRVVQEA